MDGTGKARRARWLQRAEAAYRRMFEGKSAEELVTLTQREDMAMLIGKELAAFLLEEHVAMDPAAEPVEASTTYCPKCGQPGTPAMRNVPDLFFFSRVKIESGRTPVANLAPCPGV